VIRGRWPTALAGSLFASCWQGKGFGAETS
jgi:hypothetical protein